MGKRAAVGDLTNGKAASAPAAAEASAFEIPNPFSQDSGEQSVARGTAERLKFGLGARRRPSNDFIKSSFHDGSLEQPLCRRDVGLQI